VVTQQEKLEIDIVCIARQTSKRFPNKIFMEVNGKSILELIIQKLKTCEQNIIFAIPETPTNDELYQYLLNEKVNVYRGCEENVLDRFICASNIGSAQFVQRFNCDNLLFQPSYVLQCYQELLDNDSCIYSNIECKNHSGQSVEIIRKDRCKITSSPTDYEKEHIFPYFYRMGYKRYNLSCPTTDVFPIDYPADLKRAEEELKI